MALDSSTVRLLSQLAEGDGKPLHECSPDEARALLSKLAELAGPAPEMWRVEERNIQEPDGQARLRILVPLRKSHWCSGLLPRRRMGLRFNRRV